MQTKPVLPNDWLHCLGRHRIFEASQKDTQNAHQTFSNQANTSRVMTLRGNDLILAVGSQIRVLSLNEVKDAWISAAPRFIDAGLSAFSDLNWLLDVPYRTLDTPSIDFIIESITLNNNGSLLVAQGKHKIVVVCISRRGAKGIKDLVVGKNMYGKDLGVLKCAWHPLSETDTHLVVLSSDSYLRIFDVGVNVDQEEQKFDLSPTPRGKTSTGGGFSPDDDFDEQEEAVSFALGKPSIDDCGTWELFTVYYTLRNGHIYAMCPILPCRSVIRRKHLELLGCMIEAKTQKLLEKLTEQDDDENEDNRLLYYLLRMQSAWITNVLQIAKPLDENFLLVSFTGPLFKFSIQRQGPFRTEAPTESDGQVADMMLMPNDPVMIMVVAYTNGNIHHYILGSVIEPQWLVRGRRSQENWRNQLRRFQSSTELLPEALLYEIISINTSRRQPITLAVDPLYHDTYYVYHPRGVHQIVTKKWIDKLKDLYKRQAAGKTDATELMSAWIAEDIPSNVKCLVEKSASDSEPLIGLVVLSDIYLTYSLLTLSRSYSLISKDLPFQSAESLEIGSPLSKSPKDQNDEAPFYTSPLATEPFKLTESLKTGQSTMAKLAIPKGIDGKKEIVVNEETLRFLFTVSEKYCYNIRELSKSTNVLEYRLKAQEKVLQHQIFMAQDLLNRFQVYMSNDAHDERAQRVLEATNKYAKLALRIDGVLRKMLAVYEPQLSPQEKEWIQGLEDIERKVQGENGYLKRIERLRAQLNRMKLNTEWQAALPASKCRISSTELDAFKKSLDKQTLEMNEAKQRVNALQQCLK